MAVLEIQGKSIACKAILFDKDGTLLDFLQLWGPWAESMLSQLQVWMQERGASFTVELEHVLGTLHDSQGRINGYDVQGPLAIATVDECNGWLAGQLYAAGTPWNEAITIIRGFSSAAMKSVRERKSAEPLPGLLDLLRRCKEAGLSLAVVTSDSTAAAETHLEWMGIRSFFTSIVGCDRVTRGKPDAESFLLACRELSVEAHEAMVIGDSNGDMQMGRHAGAAFTLGYCPQLDQSSYLHEADAVIHHYDELGIGLKEERE
ncbi:HAD-IA family hydrolase [Paenibacillus silvae]|uniref:HAD-IA family hydrolase n=1 Tax=Paenibacillus silvae TaxID=1325358 RepID=UPI0011A40906|nr:HAD family hydrolase [Paenibacillus xylanexedens]MCK6074986.1 HAD family hydrolase [Paenibacillus silvae]MCK6149373.1 HAD family hydrolase [Paenibacillus silvae]MCK6267672.1 HAD family hydrolase [Paenibacillus silvae]